MSRKKIAWICAISWILMFEAIAFGMAFNGVEFPAMSASRTGGWATLVDLFAFAVVVCGVLASAVALVSTAALVGAYVTRYPGAADHNEVSQKPRGIRLALRHRTVKFLLTTFGVSWLLFLPALCGLEAAGRFGFPRLAVAGGACAVSLACGWFAIRRQ